MREQSKQSISTQLINKKNAYLSSRSKLAVIAGALSIVASGAFAQTVTTTSISYLNQIKYGGNFTAVLVNVMGGTPTGTVSVKIGNTTVCTGIPLMAGKATCAPQANSPAVMALTPGTYPIVATYSGDANHAPSTSSSNSLQVDKGTQAIAFPAWASLTLQAAPHNLGGSAGKAATPLTINTLTPTVCSVGPAQIVNPQIGLYSVNVTTIAVGTCTLQANKAGDSNYEPAPTVQKSYNVVSMLNPQTVTFTAPSSVSQYSSPFTVSAAASSGLPLTISTVVESQSICWVMNGNTVTLAGVSGTCKISAFNSGSATFAPVSSTHVINVTNTKLDQTINFPNIPDQALTSGKLTLTFTPGASTSPVTIGSSPSTTCIAKGSTVTLVAKGQCTIKVSQAGDNKYNPAPMVVKTFNIF